MKSLEGNAEDVGVEKRCRRGQKQPFCLWQRIIQLNNVPSTPNPTQHDRSVL